MVLDLTPRSLIVVIPSLTTHRESCHAVIPRSRFSPTAAMTLDPAPPSLIISRKTRAHIAASGKEGFLNRKGSLPIVGAQSVILTIRAGPFARRLPEKEGANSRRDRRSVGKRVRV